MTLINQKHIKMGDTALLLCLFLSLSVKMKVYVSEHVGEMYSAVKCPFLFL